MASETPPSPPPAPVSGITLLRPAEAGPGASTSASASGLGTDRPLGQAMGQTSGDASLHAGPSEVKVFAPSNSSAITLVDELPDAYFQPTAADVQSAQASLIKRSQAINDRPLALGRTRDEERARREKERADKWPNTVIRIRFSDRTQIQQTFPSGSLVKPVYEFVRSALADDHRTMPFLLYQPPNRHFPEKLPPPPPLPAHKRRPGQSQPVQKEPTLAELQLVPQSVLLIRFDEDALNASDRPAPLQPALLARSAPLPTASEPQAAPQPPAQQPGPGADTGKRKEAPSGEKKIPKWLQKGLLKK